MPSATVLALPSKEAVAMSALLVHNARMVRMESRRRGRNTMLTTRTRRVLAAGLAAAAVYAAAVVVGWADYQVERQGDLWPDNTRRRVRPDGAHEVSEEAR